MTNFWIFCLIAMAVCAAVSTGLYLMARSAPIDAEDDYGGAP